jgi:RsiW-degrading membrane proteinase PrsW (M82 family)
VEYALLIDAVLVVLPFAFSILVMSMVRKTEIYCREPWAWVLSTFIFGSSFAVSISIVINEGISIFLGLSGFSPVLLTLVAATVIAPVVEESAKVSGVISARSRLTEVENGIIYGSAVGLGFAASENVIYFISAYYLAGVEALASTIILRFLTSTILHLGASGLAGYGIGLANVQRLAGAKPVSWKPFLLAAIGLHALFNFLSYLPSLLSERFVTEITVAVLFIVITMVWLLFTALRRKIKTLDRTSGCAIKENSP